MGRKKRKQIKPWCWYCNRDFEDEKVLISHQKAKHFKCPFCHRKLFTGPGLSIHCNAVHKEKLDKIPNALPHRCSTSIDIYGMSGIPEEDLLEHERQVTGVSGEPAEKIARTEDTKAGSSVVPPPLAFPYVPPVVPYMPMAAPIVPGVQPFLPGVVPAPPPPPPPPPPTSEANATEPATTAATTGSPKPTFPAYSEPEATKPPAPKVVRPVSSQSGFTIELVYPEDDLSLEELMAAKPKYQEMLKRAEQPQPPPMMAVPGAFYPGVVPPYMPATTGAVPYMPMQAPMYGVPGYPSVAGATSQVPPTWMGLPNVRF